MSNFAKGKHSKFISDRSGMEFPYSEMVREWNGARVHVSEFEPKQPQLEPKPHGADPQGLPNARPDRTEPAVASLLPSNPISTTANSSTISISEPNNGRAVSDVIELRNVDGSPGGLAFTVYETSFIISSVTTNTFTFNLNTTAAITENAGGAVVTAGPVTLTP
tara:strand:- start:480 stop:971 length:492 start_codon:yes stop_codon:yes gene_type:complete